jgi:hypothetical protein
MRSRLSDYFRVALTLLAVSALAVAPALAQDPFASLESTVSNNAKLWAGAIILIGAVVSGAAIVMGSQNSGKWLGRFLGGGVLLLLTLKGQQLLQWLSSSVGLGQ